jgi:hypothetical protein
LGIVFIPFRNIGEFMKVVLFVALVFAFFLTGCKDDESCGPNKKACIEGTCAAASWAKPAKGRNNNSKKVEKK